MKRNLLAVSGLLLTVGLIIAIVIPLHSQELSQNSNTGAAELSELAPKSRPEIQPIRTDSPRETLSTFRRLRNDLDKELANWPRRSRAASDRGKLISDQLVALIDLSSVPRASRGHVGEDTVLYLLDILGRVEEVDIETVPEADAFQADKGPVSWRIPKTPIHIDRIEEGSRQGEFLFSERTVQAAPRFYQGIEEMPLRSSAGIASWTDTAPQLAGPLIPVSLIAALPSRLKETWLDTPIWKILLVILVTALTGLLLSALHRLIDKHAPEGRLGPVLSRLLEPISLLVLLTLLYQFIAYEVTTRGQFSTVVDSSRTVLLYLALAWIFWLLVRIVVEWIIQSPRIDDESIDANLLRLFAGIIGVVGVILILAVGAQQLGLPVLSLLAGLGIGGLAVALAVRPTLENLIGGFALYIDKPVRVGDFCSFGDKLGTIERIGVRSTQIRAMDRTQISIPNAKFADMEIINWARCDQMLIQETIGVRYETKPDQLRYLLAKLREMFHAHPRIDSDTIRVRFAGYSDSSLNISIRIYAQTREWNDFYAIREDVFMRIYDVVTQAGSGFAFPSRTVYLGRDEGLDDQLAKTAADKVEEWRKSSRLPFPRLPEDFIDKIEGTLDYPPSGSPDAHGGKVREPEVAERLSTETSS